MKKIIFGLTDLADVLYSQLKWLKEEIDAFTVENKYFKEDTHLGKNVIRYEDLKDYYENEEIGIYLCVGYTSMNRVREKIYDKIKGDGYKLLSFIHPSAIVMSESIGEGCLIFEQASLGPYTTVGISNIFYPKSLLSHHTKVGNFNFFAISSSVAGNVYIEDNCFFGNNMTTKDGINIKSYTLAGAGSYIKQDTEEKCCIVPAKSVILEGRESTEFL